LLAVDWVRRLMTKRPESSLETEAAKIRSAFNIARHEAWMRAILAILLVVGIFAVMIYAIWSGKDVQEYALLLTPLVGLAGVAIGYFFAQGHLDTRRDSSPPPRDRLASDGTGDQPPRTQPPGS
jgi:hypothetical protein